MIRSRDATMIFRGALEPLASAPYRRFLAASVIGAVSSWIFYTAQTWNFLEASGTAAAVAFLPMVLVIPVPIALVVGGVLTDRRGPNTALVAAQALTAVTMASIALLESTHLLTFLPTLATGFVLGVCSGLGSVPAQALLMRVVDPRVVARAFALSLVTTGVGRLLGGPIGGAVAEAFGPVPAFIIAATGVLIATILFATLPKAAPLETTGVQISRRDLADAIGWVRRTPAAMALIAVDATLAGVVYPYTAIVPVVARDLLGGGAADLGILVSAGGVGAILGGAVLAPVARRAGQGRLALLAVATAGLGVAGLGFSHSVPVSSAVAALIGGTSIGASVTTGLLVQTMTPPRLRGRVLALDSVIYNLVNPASLLILGLSVDGFGAAPVLLVMGLLTALCVSAVAVAHRPVLQLDVDSSGGLSATRVGVVSRPTRAPNAN
jgi:predicted MFS family arabinose efflux permease